MKPRPPKPPNPVPEEDLNLHENFAPIIAENGLIRQPETPDVTAESLPAFLTQLDTLQDLVEIRRIRKGPPPPKGHVVDTVNVSSPAPKGKPLPTDNEVKPTSCSKEQMNGRAEAKIPQEESTFLVVRQAQTTALVPASKLTLARRITLLKRKRQHTRRLQARQKQRLKVTAQRERIRQAAGLQSTGQVPPQNTGEAVVTSRHYRKWPWVVAVLLFLLLGTISGVIPVEKIPVLRNLAYAMGFDKTDTAQMSFLRALLTWTDKTIGLPGNWAEEWKNNSLLARRDGGFADAEADEKTLGGLNALERESGQTNLIDMKALNAMQRQKGYALDGVRGAVQVPPGRDEADLGPAVVRDGNVEVRTEANRDKSEVFFGSDNSAINRNFKDAYDSTKTLAKIKNPHIADGKPIDWLLNTTQQLMRTNGPLGGLNRQLEGTRVSWGDTISSLGEQKPHKDLYFAWITSRMGQRTPNVMIKKSLVDTGFLGADIPMMASTALGGGVQIDSTSFQADQENWKEYLEWEKQCKEAFNTAGKRISERIDKFNNLVNEETNWDFPRNCFEALASGKTYDNSQFKKSVGEVQSYCKQIDADYKILENQCYLQVERPANVCNDSISGKYQTHWNNFMTMCNSEFDAAFNAWNAAHPKETITKEKYKTLEDWAKRGKEYQESNYINDNIRNRADNNPENYSQGITMRNVVIDQQGGSGDYFPTEGDVKQTIEQQMAENKTL